MLRRHSTSVGMPEFCSLCRPGTCSVTGVSMMEVWWRKSSGELTHRPLWFAASVFTRRHLWRRWRVNGLTGLAFLAPTLARWTISFLSPSCIPLSPATAWRVHDRHRDHGETHNTEASAQTQARRRPALPDRWRWCPRIRRRRNLWTVTWHCPSPGWTLWEARTTSAAPSPAKNSRQRRNEANN